MIYIFGDSFSSEYIDVYFNGEIGPCWYELVQKELSEKNVRNYSKGGTGPYSSMKEFYHVVENGNLKSDDKIIFMLSSQYRIPFEFLNNDKFHGGQDFIDYFLNDEDILDEYENDQGTFCPTEKYIKNYSYEIILTYKTLKDEIDRANVKNIYFLKTFSQLKKIKIICFLCFEYNKYVSYDLNNLNDDYFKLHHETLWNVSLQENVDEKTNADTPNNQRANHLSYCNHRILANIILNFFSEYPFDLDEKFHKHIIKDSQNEKKSFLYD